MTVRDRATRESLISLGCELLIHTNATLSELVRIPDATIDHKVVTGIRALLDATTAFIGRTHFNDNAEAALTTSGNARAGTAVDALRQARHSLRILDALYGPQPATDPDLS